MRALDLLLCTVLACSAFGQVPSTTEQGHPRSLDAVVEQFDLTNGIFQDGVSELSLKNIAGLHLGLEEIIRDRMEDDPRAQSPQFSMHLKSKTVREILDELCQFDPRYAWSQDMATINIYPRITVADQSYLLNLWIDTLAISDAPDPDQALTPLWRKFPTQQIGYAGPGLGRNSYAKGWTTVFERLTVRQFINRVAEHTGQQTSWIWYGGKGERLFTFVMGGFHNGPK